MLDRFLTWLLRCRHSNLGIPVTLWVGETTNTTIFCQDCGARLKYDLVNMKVIQ